MKAWLLAAVVAWPLVAAANPKQSKAHVSKAMAAHQQGKFDVALRELETAYKLDPQPDLLFAIAQVHAKLGQCREAIAYYQKFLGVTKDRDAKEVVAQAIAACKAAEPPPPPPVDDPPPPPPVDDPPPPPPVDKPPPPPVDKPAPFAESQRPSEPIVVHERAPWYKDPLGDGLVLGGTVLGIAAGVLYLGARSELDAAERAGTLAEYEDKLDSASGKRTLSVVLVGGSVALVGAGVVRYMLRSGRTRDRVGVVPARDGGMVTWMGRF